MSREQRNPSTGRRDAAEFASTRWSLVLAAGDREDTDAHEALAVLCRDYWYPLYAYVRRRGHDVHEAQDLIQEFFTRLLDKNLLALADPQRGRFRSFLLTSLRHFLTNQWEKSRAAKRGGARATLSLDLREGESRFIREPAEPLTPEKLFERRWAETLLDRVTLRLRDEYQRSGKQIHFERLSPFLAGGRAAESYAEAARALNLSEGAAMVAAHRMRRRFRDLLRTEIAQTVRGDEDIDDEIRRLFEALGK